MKKVNKSQGIIYVATVKSIYYGMAVASCMSLRKHYPDCHVTLFTHEDWVDEYADLFDNIITEDVPAHRRAKMWAMARTPYDRTLYIDVDSLIMSKDVKKIFDQISDDDDFGFVKSIPLTASSDKWAYIDIDQTESPPIDGSFMLYNKSDLMIDFLQSWYEEYREQLTLTKSTWPYSFAYFDWRQFDMFTIWRMLVADWDKFPEAKNLKYEKFRKLKSVEIEKHFNGVPFIPTRLLNGKRVIIQIPIKEYADYLPDIWETVEKAMVNKNDRCYFKEP